MLRRSSENEKSMDLRAEMLLIPDGNEGIFEYQIAL